MSGRSSILLFVFFAFVGCSRNSSNNTAAPTDASPENDGPLLSVAPPLTDAEAAPQFRMSLDAGFSLRSVPAIEARRVHIAHLSDDAALRGIADVFTKHFSSYDGGSASPPSGFDVQVAELTASGRRAVLVMEADKASSTDAHPFLAIADDQDHSLWTRRPIGGIMAPVGPIALAAAPAGRVALAACDPPTNILALRIFDDDGSPFADFQAMSVDGCDALSILYWPRHGWIVVAARQGATRARLVTEDGALSWGSQGLDLGARSRAGAIAPASLASDTDDTFVLVQVVQPTAADGSPFHGLAFRYDAHGTAIWPAAVDLGEVPRPASSTSGDPRVKIAQTKPGVRVTFSGSSGGGGAGALGTEKEVDVKPSGDVTPRVRAPR